MDKRPIMNKWHARLLSVALVFTVLCGMGWPRKAMVADAVESSVTEVTPGEVALGEVTPGDPEEGEESLADGYLGEIAALKAEAEAIGGTTADVTSMCAGVYERLMGVYDEAFAAWEADRITDDEMDAVDAATGEVMAVLNGYGYDPYAVATMDQNSDIFYWNNTKNVNYFYWRFERTDLTSNNTGATGNDFTTVNALYDKVKVTYTNGNSGSGVVPYTIYNNHTTGYTEQTSAGLNCSTVLGASSSSDFESSTVHVETEIGYVITGYVIACETKGTSGGVHIGEACTTTANYSLQVNLDTTGKYYSSFDIDITPATFGHDSNAKDSNNYVLLLQIARVNVEITVNKEADRDSVPAGGYVNYTVSANTTNDLTQVQFADEFLKTATVTGVYYHASAADYTTGNSLSLSSNNFSSYTGTPSSYYVDKTVGILYLNGKWTKDYTITITYTYTTADDESIYGETITNTVVATGTKTDTTDTVQDVGIAHVDVLVNDPNYGSIRVYKTFSGLSEEHVTELLTSFDVTVNNSEKEVELSDRKGGSQQYTYYWDAEQLSIGSYIVSESKYTVEGYDCSSTYSVQIGDGDKNSATVYSSEGIQVEIQKGVTTFVYLTNEYTQSTTSVTIDKTVTGGLGDRSKAFNFNATLKKADGSIYKLSQGSYAATDQSVAYTVAEDGTITFDLKHKEQVVIQDVPLGATITVLESDALTSDYSVIINNSYDDDASYSIEVIDGLEISFENNKEAEPDTGVLLDSLPYILILVIVIIGVIVMIIRRRRSYDED